MGRGSPSGAWELFGAVLVGAAVGVPTAYVTGRIQAGKPALAEALAAVFLCGGIAMRLEVSFLLASMVLGAVVANLARHHTRPFHAIEGIEWLHDPLLRAGRRLRAARVAEIGGILLPAVIAATVVFEVLGPIATRQALVWVGEAGRGDGAE